MHDNFLLNTKQLSLKNLHLKHEAIDNLFKHSFDDFEFALFSKGLEDEKIHMARNTHHLLFLIGIYWIGTQI